MLQDNPLLWQKAMAKFSQWTIVAASRYLAAHAPTARARRQTANLALRLHRGDDLSADNPDEAVD
jgi:hypothetical protein